MAILVSDLLELAEDSQIRCVAGFEGLNKEVTDFTIIDTPDIFNWLKGGELVMATGYIFWMNPTMIGSIIPNLMEKGCAGLAFKIKRYYDEIPKVIIDMGNKYNFPILELSYELRVSDFSRFVYYNIFYFENRYKDKIFSLTSNLLRTINTDKKHYEPLSEIVKYVNNPLFLLNNQMKLLLYEIPEDNKVNINKYLNLNLDEEIFDSKNTKYLKQHFNTTDYNSHTMILSKDENLKFTIFSIIKNNELLGYLGFLESIDKLGGDDYKIIESILPIMALYIAKEKETDYSYLLSRDGFVQNILLEDNQSQENIIKNCLIYNFDVDKKRICMVLEISEYSSLSFEEKNWAYNYIIDSVKKYIDDDIQLFYRFYQHYFIFFLLFDTKTLNNDILTKAHDLAGKVSEDINKELRRKSIKYRIGISLSSDNVEDINTNFNESVKAINLGSKLFPRDNVFSYRDNILYHIMYNSDVDKISEIYYNTIYGLDLFDRDNDGELVKTLEAYFDNQYNISKTADALYVHRNTMAYRLKKIKDITNIDLENDNELFNMRIGLFAKKVLDISI